MTHFYVQRSDEDQCRNAVITQEPITVTGLTFNGTVLVFTGVVLIVENIPVARSNKSNLPSLRGDLVVRQNRKARKNIDGANTVSIPERRSGIFGIGCLSLLL